MIGYIDMDIFGIVFIPFSNSNYNKKVAFKLFEFWFESIGIEALLFTVRSGHRYPTKSIVGDEFNQLTCACPLPAVKNEPIYLCFGNKGLSFFLNKLNKIIWEIPAVNKDIWEIKFFFGRIFYKFFGKFNFTFEIFNTNSEEAIIFWNIWL